MATADRQGYLTDLHTKPLEELIELLKRQEKLVSNVSFVKRLPDKGAKIYAMIDKIKATMKHVEDVDKTADLFEKMAIQSEHARQKRLGWDGMEMDEADEELLRSIANRGQQEQKDVSDEKTEDPEPKFINSYEKVIKKAEQRSSKYKFRPNRTIRSKDVQSLSDQVSSVSLQSKRDMISLDTPVETSGDRVVVETSGDGTVKQTSLHELNARLSAGKPTVEHSGQNGDNTDSIDYSVPEKQITLTSDNHHTDNLPESQSTSSKHNKPGVAEKFSPSQKLLGMLENVVPSEACSGVSGKNTKLLSDHADARGKLKYHYDELLETSNYTGKPHHQAAMMISIEEAALLQSSQQKVVQELHVQAAAEKLSERLHVKMETYKPEGSGTMRYREQLAPSDDDQDSDDELDYPD